MSLRQDPFAEIASGYEELARTTSASRYADLLACVLPGTTRVLDAGCGSGLLAARVARPVRQVVGMDVSPAMLALATRRRDEGAVTNLTFVLGDVEAPPFPDHSFDLVLSCNALHATCVDRALPALRRLVRAGGRIVVVDLVASWPRLQATRPWRVASTTIAVPRLAVRVGPRAAWRLTMFRLWRTWRGAWHAGCLPTPRASRDAYERHLPGCRIARPHRWTMTAIWDAPP